MRFLTASIKMGTYNAITRVKAQRQPSGMQLCLDSFFLDVSPGQRDDFRVILPGFFFQDYREEQPQI
jgi:hypothetical protein